MSEHTVESAHRSAHRCAGQFAFDFFAHSPVVVQPHPGQLTSDAGLLAFRQFDQRWRFSARLAACLKDSRTAPLHDTRVMLRQRLFGVLADYEDCNDHDALRHDPIFKLIADRRPTDDPLASQPTLSRFENRVTVPDLQRMIDFLADTGIERLRSKNDGRLPDSITLDLDPTDDPTHGQQQLSLFHGYYDQHQYLPMIISEPTTKHIFLARLRHGTAHAALGADDDLNELVAHLRKARADVKVHARADAGFGVPRMIDCCEALPDVTYTFGFTRNPKLEALTQSLVQRAREDYEKTLAKQRIFTFFAYQAKDWKKPRTIIAKAEHHAGGANLRFVITNLPVQSDEDARRIYDDYIQRGESEQRMNELKNGLHAGRLSCHRLKANFFRLLLHTAAYNLLAALRDHADVPQELRTAQPQTWRSKVVKVAGLVITSTRRVLIQIAAAWPFAALLEQVSRRAAAAVT